MYSISSMIRILGVQWHSINLVSWTLCRQNLFLCASVISDYTRACTRECSPTPLTYIFKVSSSRDKLKVRGSAKHHQNCLIYRGLRRMLSNSTDMYFQSLSSADKWKAHVWHLQCNLLPPTRKLSHIFSPNPKISRGRHWGWGGSAMLVAAMLSGFLVIINAQVLWN